MWWHDFFHMTLGSGVALATAITCLFMSFRMMVELLGDIIESIPEESK